MGFTMTSPYMYTLCPLLFCPILLSSPPIPWVPFPNSSSSTFIFALVFTFRETLWTSLLSLASCVVLGKQGSTHQKLCYLEIEEGSSMGRHNIHRLVKPPSQVICLLSNMWKENHTDASSVVIINEWIKPAMVVYNTFNPSTCGQIFVDICEFKANPIYLVSSRPTRAT